MPVMNQNFVVAVDIGKSFNKQDGNIGISIGTELLVLVYDRRCSFKPARPAPVTGL